ncbi:hypothetical protein AGMMS50276_01440 [Synergistales bacterium]|nr:hypothetical protein AGMMS50276_01440 [Synergistales bacterium]
MVILTVVLLLCVSIAVNVLLLRRKDDIDKRRVRSTLLRGIRNVKELATIRQNFQSIVMYEENKAFWGLVLPGTARKFILKYSGIVVCGNDLSGIQVSEAFAVNRFRIIVPRSKILDIYADIRSVQVYDQKAGIFTSIKLQEQNREIAANLEEVRKDALQSDILRRADENTSMVLTTMAASFGVEAEIIFDDQDKNIMRPTRISDLLRADPKSPENASETEPAPVIPETVSVN